MNGLRVEIRNVADADRLGIRVIHQELSLAPNLSVAENLFLGASRYGSGCWTAAGCSTRRKGS